MTPPSARSSHRAPNIAATRAVSTAERTNLRTGPVPNTDKRAIRVLCVDDHAVLIEGLKAQFAIDGSIEIVGQLASAEQMVSEAKRLKPDVVLLDIEMPGPDVFDATTQLKRVCPAVGVMILSAHVRDGYIAAAFSAGANAYFSKSDSIEEIMDGVRQLVKAEDDCCLLGPSVIQRCCVPTTGFASRTPQRKVEGASPGTAEAQRPMTLLASLTSRESEILRLIGRGLSRVQISALLCRSVKTIDGHQERMMKKLAIGSRADLIRFAIREGLAQA